MRCGSGCGRHATEIRSANAPPSARARYGLPPESACSRLAARAGNAYRSSSSAISSASRGGTAISVTGVGARAAARGVSSGRTAVVLLGPTLGDDRAHLATDDPAGGVRDDVGRRAIEPLRVVDEEQHRPAFGAPFQQRVPGQPAAEPGPAAGTAGALAQQHRVHHRALRFGQFGQVLHRQLTEQVGQAGVGDPAFGLGAGDPQHPLTAGGGDRADCIDHRGFAYAAGSGQHDTPARREL